MKVWIVVGALNGQIDDVGVFRKKEKAIKAQRNWGKAYSFPEKSSNDVQLFEREISEE